MKVTEARFTRRYNVGQYEHEEYTVIAQLEEDDSIVDALVELKSDVQKAYAGEASASSGAGTEDADTEDENKPAKRSKKSSKSRTTTRSEDEEADENEDEDGGDETDTDSEEETDEDESEDSEESEDESEEEDAPAKKPAKKTPSKDGAKGSKKFKKKPQVYQRANETHKDIFSATLKKVAPNWKKSFEAKAHAKKVSQKLEGKEFLDENGKVLPSFEAEVKKAMGKFGK